jgi:beta-lactamase regulating signal transducer with metallopeptidase domain
MTMESESATAVVVLLGAWTFLVAGAMLVTAHSKWLSASVRHLLWVATLGGLLLSGVLALLGGEIRLPVLAAQETDSGGRIDSPQREPRLASRAAPRDGRDAMTATTTSSAPPIADASPAAAASWFPIRAPVQLAWLWGLGAALLAVRMVRARAARRALQQDSHPLVDERSMAALKRARAVLGVQRQVTLRESPTLTTPVTFGVRQAVVLLPTSVRAWSDERLESALLHEVGHVLRRDALWHLLAQGTRLVGWWHPLVWVAVRQEGIAREQACDDLVLQRGVAPSSYAQLLLEIATAVGAAPKLTHVLGMAHLSELELRIVAILSPERARGAAGRPIRLLIAPAALLVGLLTAARPVPRAAAPPAITAQAARALPQATRRTDLRRPTRGLGVSDSLGGTGTLTFNNRSLRLESWRGIAHLSSDEWIAADNCTRMRQRRPSAIAVWDEHGVRARAANAERCLALHVEGAVDIDVDGPDLGALPRKGQAELVDSHDGVRHSFLVGHDRSGRLRREFRRDDMLIDATEGERWLATARIALAQQTGLGLERWMQRLSRERGAQAVLGAARQVSSSEARRDIYLGLLEETGLTAMLLDSILIESASLPIEGQRARVLEAAARRARGGDLDRVISAASRLTSDDLRQGVLEIAIDSLRAGAAVLPSLFTAISGMRASSVRAMLLRALCASPSRGPDALLRALALVPSLTSDEDKADVLFEIERTVERAAGTADESLMGANRTPADRIARIQSALRRMQARQ